MNGGYPGVGVEHGGMRVRRSLRIFQSGFMSVIESFSPGDTTLTFSVVYEPKRYLNFAVNTSMIGSSIAS